MKDKLIKAMQSKTFWMAFISLVTGVCMQLGLVTFGQQFNAIMALVIPFLIAVGLIHDNGASKTEQVKDDKEVV
ncbi:MAG: hypothetical protein ACRDAO_08210 [Culicoidibacterales bacterium]